MSETVSVAIAGATGYTGVELVRILRNHPRVRLQTLTTQNYVGQPLAGVYPHLYPFLGDVCEEQDIEKLVQADAVFLALPQGHTTPVAEAALKAGCRLIDLGADLRLRDPGVYQQWYKLEAAPETLLGEAVYGLPELNRKSVQGARVIANPGCYPTSALLALAPAVANGLIDVNSIIIDAKSGVSGAGRSLSVNSLFCEVNDGIRPYNVASHRHTPEIEQGLTQLAGQEVKVVFTAHLTPMTRGILCTVYARPSAGVDFGTVRLAYENAYRDEPFVHVLPIGAWPHTKWVYGSNHCLLNLALDERSGVLIIASVIDNLVKGASGQAVQNFNTMFGWDETIALEALPVYP